MTIDPIQTGILAYGMSGRLFQAPFVAAHPGFALRAITERHQKRAAQDYPGLISYDTVEALLADAAVELVIVNTPSTTHVALAAQALRAGKHVLIEKPVAPTVAELNGLLALAGQVGRRVLAYQNRRWDSDFRAAQAVVESGQLGRLLEAHFRYDRFKTTLNPKPFKEDPVPGSGLDFDLGPHLVDQAITLFGPPLRSTKTVGCFRPGSRVTDYFHLHLRYPENLNVFLSGSLLVAQPEAAYVLHGTQGSFTKARADVQEAQLLLGLAPTAPTFGVEDPAQAGALTLADPTTAARTALAYPSQPGNYLPLFEAVYQTLRHDQPYPIRDEDLRAQLEVLAGEGGG